MAVLIQGFSVIVRRATLDAKYKGGSAEYQRDCPNATFCADEHLCRIGFMVERDAEIFVAHLAAKGLTPSRGGAAEDVAIADAEKGLLCPCPWLVVGRFGKWAIAWFAGAPQGELHAPQGWDADAEMRYISAEEMNERLEFVRAEDGVDVYRDKTTGRQLYVGRAFDEPADSSSRYAELYQQACKLIEGLLAAGNEEPGRLRRRDRNRLQDAAPLFVEAVELNPESWPAMWLLGKIYQRLGDHAASLAWFSRAHRVNPDHPDVAREAAIAAMDLGRPDEAVGICERAIEASPDDAGLHANLALALLFSQRPVEAQVVVHDAVIREPADEITRNIAAIIEEVIRGKRRCPRHIRDLSCWEKIMSPLTRRGFLSGSAVAACATVAGAAEPAARPKIKIGQIGVGHAHASKLAVFRRSHDFEVVGVVEDDDQLRDWAASQPAFRDLPWLTRRQLLDVPGLQVVLVETRVRDLLDAAEAAVAAGKHVHLDKPAGESLPQYRRILHSAASQKLLVQMGYMYRYNPGVVLLRQALQAGWLGEVFEVTAVMSKVVAPADRRKLAEYPGGIMFELGCHVIDLVIGALGKPDRVTAFPRRVSPADDKLVDNMLAVLEYPRATATVRSSAVEVDGFSRRHLTVCGTQGTFHIQPLDNPAVRATFAAPHGDYRAGYQDIALPKYERYIADAADIAAVIRGEKPADFSYQHDLAVQETLVRASGLSG